MIGEHLEQYTYANMMASALSRIPDSVDKREGSLIFDALAPACYELAGFYMELRNMIKETYILTSSGQYLDYRAAEQGLERLAASKAKRRAVFHGANGEPFSLSVGSRFSTIDEVAPVTFVVEDTYMVDGNPVEGVYVLECETPGTVGNEYIGNPMPVSYIKGLEVAYMDTIILPARDEETDDELRERYFTTINNKPFGGNIAQYRELLKEIDGVGECQIYPVWNGGGTVKLSVIDSNYNAASQDFINLLQERIDPNEQGSGLGLAPIGHRVTVVTPQTVRIDVDCTVNLQSGFLLSQIESGIKDELEKYVLSLRKQWGTAGERNQYSLSVYVSQINAAILRATGVANVSNTKLNGGSLDWLLQESATAQELPMLGQVMIHVN